MKIINILFVINIVILLLGCSSKEERISGEVLDMYGLNSTIKQIKNQGFKLIPDDSILYEKKIKDTLVIVNFHRDFKDLRFIVWKINLDNSEKYYVNNYLNNRGFSRRTSFKDRSYGYSFTAMRREKENVIIYFEVDQNPPVLSITYYIPRDGRGTN